MTLTHTRRGCVFSIQYHVVWCVKYRRKVITEEVHQFLKMVLNAIATSNNFRIVEYNTEPDHVHVLIECSPIHYIPNVIQKLKGVSSKMLINEFGYRIKKQLWGGHVWSPSYFVATVSENTEQQIKEYIRSQRR